MNAGKQPIFVVNQDCSCTVVQAAEQLNAAGYSVVRSFDLLSAQPVYSTLNTRKIILLVYGQEGPPATLVFDGTCSRTAVFLENETERTTGSRITAILSKIAGNAPKDNEPASAP